MATSTPTKKKGGAPKRLPERPNINGSMFAGMELDRCAKYSTSEVAKFFFFRSAAWLRWKQSEGSFTNPSNGKTVTPERDRRNARKYSLLDIESLATSLRANGDINDDQFAVAKSILWWMGVGNGLPYGPAPEQPDG